MQYFQRQNVYDLRGLKEKENTIHLEKVIYFGKAKTVAVAAVGANSPSIGVCGVRFFWIFAVFPQYKTFTTIMMAYPISLATTAVLIFIASMFYRPSHKLNMQ